MSSSSNNCESKQFQSVTRRRVHHQNLSKRGKEMDTDDNNLFDIPYLPTPIVLDILSRVVIKTLLKCRLVCKSWASLISTYEFSQLHLLRSSPTNCLIKEASIFDDYHYNVIHLLDPEYPYSLENKLLFKPMINLPDIKFFFSNSFNGLVCLVPIIFGVSNIYVCNPILREYLILTLPSPSVKHNASIKCLFGFSQNTNQYKVVVSYDKSHNMIYTCGQRSWKTIGSSPCSILNDSYNALVNGYLHWMSLFSDEDPFIICCFDFDSEKFHVVPEPSEFHSHEMEHCDRMCIGVLNGNLSIFCSEYPVSDGHVVIWVMKNYGVKESWCKDFVINCSMFNYYGVELEELEPIMVIGNGEILIICNNEFLILYDTISETFRSKQQILGIDIRCHGIAYTPSLISLKDVAKGENIKVVGRN